MLLAAPSLGLATPTGPTFRGAAPTLLNPIPTTLLESVRRAAPKLKTTRWDWGGVSKQSETLPETFSVLPRMIEDANNDA